VARTSWEVKCAPINRRVRDLYRIRLPPIQRCAGRLWRRQLHLSTATTWVVAPHRVVLRTLAVHLPVLRA
jgi:hypothetical protein